MTRPGSPVIDDLLARVSASVREHLPESPDICVALSGGLDSSVLFDVLCRLGPTHGMRLRALHVHHGLSPNANDWAAHCERVAAARGIAIEVVRVVVPRPSRAGLEAQARESRYGALRASGASVVALAHHRDDQAETVLLQAVRGTGIAGLAAMAPARRDGAILWWRPLLEVPREAIRRYATATGLAWVEDESNARLDAARNALRLEVLPALSVPFPQARESLAALAAHAASASRLLDDVAREDLARLLREGAIDAGGLAALSPERQAGVLRTVVRDHGLPMPSRARLDAWRAQLLGARADAQPLAAHAGWQWRRHGGLLRLQPSGEAGREPWSCPWSGGAEVDLGPGRGSVRFTEAERGIDPRRLGSGQWSFGPRQGGERLRPRAGGPSRTLKNLLREAGVPPYERGSLPLLFLDGRLVWAPGVGVCADHAASPGWLPDWRRPTRPASA